jgi:hypothetical protein
VAEGEGARAAQGGDVEGEGVAAGGGGGCIAGGTRGEHQLGTQAGQAELAPVVSRWDRKRKVDCQ